MTSAGNVISHISSSAVVSLPLIRIRIRNDDAWTTGMNKESISLKQEFKGKWPKAILLCWLDLR